jgi:hypothetical protein
MSAKDKVERSKSIVRGVAGQGGDLVNVMLTLVIAGVAGFAGIYALAVTETSISMPTDSSLNGSLENLGGGLSDAFGLAPVVFIILMLSVAIFYLVRLRGNR